MEEQRIQFMPQEAPAVPIEIGAGANAEQIGSTAHHLLRGGRPWYPVMGEFHYSRYPAGEWEIELRKMKAAGVQIVATYVFWIHHEEEQGVWRTDGNLDLRRFLALCQRTGLEVLLRIGPWAHGECRNGGFPDWLQHDKTIAARTDDPAYLALVRGLYAHIYESAQGMLLKDGGPIIGVQLENEYGHCGGESGGSGLVHMRTLKRLAQEAGFLVPIYTATGWGGGNVVDGEMLPVMGGYADAPWDHSLEPLPANRNFLLLPAPNDPMIASDWQHGGERFTYRVDAYPYLTAELGGGVQCTFHRRPLITATDTAAQALCKLGTGANLLGYYMFHGGTHPMGLHCTMQESTATGSWTDVPVRSYDFQAPLGEFGEMHASYGELKALHRAVQDCGEALAGSMCYYPATQVTDPENLTDLRWSVRWNADTEEGFLFINNHQRLRSMRPHKDVRFVIQVGEKTFELPPMDIPADFYGIVPVNLRVGGHRLLTTNALLLGYEHGAPLLYTWDGQQIEVRFDAPGCPFHVLSREEALHAWRVGGETYISDACLLETEQGMTVISKTPQAQLRRVADGAAFTVFAKRVDVSASMREIECNASYTAWQVELEGLPIDAQAGDQAEDQIEDVLLHLDYTGDHAAVLLDGKLIADWYTTGQPWQIALKRFGYPRQLEVRVYPVERRTYFEIPRPQSRHLNAVSASARYRMTLPERALGRRD